MALLAVLQTFSAAGVLFGWNALETALRAEGVFEHLCGAAAVAAGDGCSAQTMRLALLFTVGATVQTVASLPVGALLDRFGPRRTTVCSAVAFGLGMLCLALASAQRHGFYYPAVTLLGLASPGLLFSTFHISVLFAGAGRDKLVVALLNGGFDASSAVFMIFEQLSRDPGVPLSTLAAAYGGTVSIGLAAIALFAWPDDSFEMAPAAGSPPLPTTAAAATPPEPPKPLGKVPPTPVQQPPALEEDLSAMPFRSQVRSRTFVMQLCFFCVHMLKFTWYISTLFKQLEQMGQDPDDPSQLRLFSVLLPCGIILNPLVGWLMDHAPFYASTAFASATALVFGAVASSMELGAQPAAFVAFAVFRSSFYSVTTAFVTATFGFTNFGKLWGLTIFVSAFVSLLQYLFLHFVYASFDGRFNFFNHFMTGLNVLSFAFPVWLWAQQKARPAPGGGGGGGGGQTVARSGPAAGGGDGGSEKHVVAVAAMAQVSPSASI